MHPCVLVPCVCSRVSNPKYQAKKDCGSLVKDISTANSTNIVRTRPSSGAPPEGNQKSSELSPLSARTTTKERRASESIGKDQLPNDREESQSSRESPYLTGLTQHLWSQSVCCQLGGGGGGGGGNGKGGCRAEADEVGALLHSCRMAHRDLTRLSPLWVESLRRLSGVTTASTWEGIDSVGNGGGVSIEYTTVGREMEWQKQETDDGQNVAAMCFRYPTNSEMKKPCLVLISSRLRAQAFVRNSSFLLSSKTSCTTRMRKLSIGINSRGWNGGWGKRRRNLD